MRLTKRRAEAGARSERRAGHSEAASALWRGARADLWLTDGVHLEADLLQAVVVQQVAAVEQESRLHHLAVEIVVPVSLELVPLREDDNRVRSVDSFLWRGSEGEQLVVDLHAVVLELRDGVLLLHLWVVHVNQRPILHQHVADSQGRRLAHVARVLLEGEAEDCDFLPGDSVEQGVYDPARERLLLVLVHVDDLLPVLGHFVQAELLANIHEIQDVLLEAGAAKTDGSVEELLSDARVGADSSGHLPDIGPRA